MLFKCGKLYTRYLYKHFILISDTVNSLLSMRAVNL